MSRPSSESTTRWIPSVDSEHARARAARERAAASGFGSFTVLMTESIAQVLPLVIRSREQDPLPQKLASVFGRKPGIPARRLCAPEFRERNHRCAKLGGHD